MAIETNDSTAQIRMTKTEYAARCAELDKRDIVNLVTCRHHLRVLLDNIGKEGTQASSRSKLRRPLAWCPRRIPMRRTALSGKSRSFRMSWSRSRCRWTVRHDLRVAWTWRSAGRATGQWRL